ncbi:MAG: leucyl/phenylalanyl-tRNA--protein transferase [Porticoccaceae bacterium]
MQLAVLDPINPDFPDPNTALDDPDGLLAVGGNLQPDTLLSAYYNGIFPWYNKDDPILWWSPSTRCVINPLDLHISKSLQKLLRQQRFTISFDQAFEQVINACAQRDSKTDTWINSDMISAYIALKKLGVAHSVEVWQGSRLVGGAYGVAIGAVFCGESMFSKESNASKVALVHLTQYLSGLGFQLIDCQLVSSHLLTMGAKSLKRPKFLQILQKLRNINTDFSPSKSPL